MQRLTKRAIDSATPPADGADLFIWDSEVRGFGVRVKKTGTKSFILKCRVGRLTVQTTICKVGSPYTVDEARDKARELLRDAAEGIDPRQVKKARREGITVADLADLYLGPEGKADKPNKKASSWDTDGRVIRRHIVPLLGQKQVKVLTADDIKRFQADVTAGKTALDEKMGFRKRAIVKGGKSVARLATVVLGAMLQFGIKQGALTNNPAKGVELNVNDKRERFLSEKEVATIAEGMTILESIGMLHATIGTAIRLLLLTGCRKNEIAGLKWEWVDFDHRCLRLPDSKTGAKVVPLGGPPLKLLADIQRKSKWVLPAIKGEGHVVGLQRAWETVRVWCGLEEVRIHDLRHSFASFAAADGASLYLIGKVLGHSQTRTTERYAHLADDPLKTVAEHTAGRIASALGLKAKEALRRS